MPRAPESWRWRRAPPRSWGPPASSWRWLRPSRARGDARRPPATRRLGARIVEWAPARTPAIGGADHLPLPPSAEEDLAPLTAVAPVALLAFAVARRRGHDHEHPAWIERYHSQGLRHIVGVGDAVPEG